MDGSWKTQVYRFPALQCFDIDCCSQKDMLIDLRHSIVFFVCVQRFKPYNFDALGQVLSCSIMYRVLVYRDGAWCRIPAQAACTRF